MALQFHPHLENLERRDCLSVTTSLADAGHTLVIKGNADQETVRITQNDVNNTLTVESFVTKAGSVGTTTTRTFSSSAITKVTIDLGAGDDTVMYQLAAGTNLTNAKNFWVQTAGGDDTVLVDLAHGSAGDPHLGRIEARLNFYSITGHGADTVRIQSGHIGSQASVNFNTTLGGDDDVYSFTQIGDVEYRADLLAYVDGGAGRDQLRALVSGNVSQQALVDVLFRGGIGDDSISAELCGRLDGMCYLRTFGDKGADAVAILATCSELSTGDLSIKTYGQAGNDQISETTSEATAQLMFDSILTGGTGSNVVVAEQIPTT